MIDFLNIFRYNYPDLTQSDIEKADEYADSMPSWPAEGCLRNFGDLVVFKLSEDPYWAAENLRPDCTVLDAVPAERGSGLVARVSGLRLENGAVTLRGYCYLPGRAADGLTAEVLVQNTRTGEVWSVFSARAIRRDVTKSNWRASGGRTSPSRFTASTGYGAELSGTGTIPFGDCTTCCGSACFCGRGRYERRKKRHGQRSHPH